MAETAGGAPLMLLGDFARLPTNGLDEGAFQPALERVARALTVPASELLLVSVERDELGMVHARYVQQIGGLEVVGADLRLHADTTRRVFASTGGAASSRRSSATPEIDASNAEWIATGDNAELRLIDNEAPRLVYVLTPDQPAALLAYEVLVNGFDARGPVRDKVYVDAHNGSVVARHPQIHYARDRKTYTANNSQSLPGTLSRAEGSSAVDNVDVNAAYDNTGYVYDYYFATFGRDSFDNQGKSLLSTVNYGRSYNNAFWDGTRMVYGDGDGEVLSPLARAVDVTAHELTHAVTEHTANLVYSGESGGLNEAMSDIFGNVVEAQKNGVVDERTWMVGEEVWTPKQPGDALRYMDDPTKDGNSLDDYNDMDGWIDVHYSSGIANLAFKLLVTGGTHPRGKSPAVVPALGIDRAAAIFYRALATYLTANSNFEAARAATAQAAQDLYGAEAIAAVHLAWDAVNVPGSPNGPADPEAELLENGVAKSGVGGAKGSKTYFKVELPEGAALRVETSGGTGDADLFVRYGQLPNSTYDAASEGSTNDERVNIAGTKAGTYFILVKGYSAYSGLSIVASY